MSWDLTSNLSSVITLPNYINYNSIGYGSGSFNQGSFNINIIGNRTTSTGSGYSVYHNDNPSIYAAQFGYNSSGRLVDGMGGYIQFQSAYSYIYSTDDIYFLSKSSTANKVVVKIQIMNNPDKVYISSNTNLNNYNLENTNQITVSNIYPNTTNNANVQVNSNLHCTGILKTDTIQAYSQNNLILFNNNTNHQNNNVYNINSVYLSNLYAYSQVSPNINFKNNTDFNKSGGSIITNYLLDGSNTNHMKYTTDAGIRMSMNSPLGSNQFVCYYLRCELDTTKDMYLILSRISDNSYRGQLVFNVPFQLMTSLHTRLYIPYSTASQVIMTTENNHLSFNSNGVLYTNNIRPVGTNVDMYWMRSQTQLDMNGYNIINCPNIGGGGGIVNSDSINFNFGSVNYLSRNLNTINGVQIFGLDSNSFILQNNAGENAGCGASGNNDHFTIWTAGDTGSHCNFQDEDGSNSRVAYVSSAGTFVQVSTKLRKHSIKNKNNNNILNRLMKIKIKSYGLKYEFNENDTEKKKQRLLNKSRRQQMGVILEDVYEILPNIIDKYDNELDDELIDDENIKNKYTTFKNKPKLEEIDDLKNQGVDYAKLNLYHLLGFQQHVKEVDERFKKLENNNNSNIDNSLITRNNLYITDKLDEYDTRIQNIEYNNLKIDDIYKIKSIINSQDEIYKCINNDINKVKLENDILRDKHIEYVEKNIVINKILNDKVVGLESEINELKEENNKFKIALKMIMGKLDKKA